METKIKDKLYFFHIYHHRNYFLFVRIKSNQEIFCHDFRKIALLRQCKHSKKLDHFFCAKIYYFLVDYKERRRPLRLTFHLSFIFFLETISTTTTMTDEICMFSFCSFGNHAQAHAQVGWDFKFKCQIVFPFLSFLSSSSSITCFYHTSTI